MKNISEKAMNRILVLVFLVVGIGMALIVKEIGSKDIPAQRTFVNAKTLYNQELEEDNLKVKNEELGKKIAAEQKKTRHLRGGPEGHRG